MINDKFIGKFLIRKGKTSNGKKIVTITGVFNCDDSDLINDNDEMWVAELRIIGEKMIKYKGLKHGFTSPEDFLEGNGMHPESWKEKEVIQLK